MNKTCTICGRIIDERYTRKTMHPECALELKKTALLVRYHAWKKDRRALYFENKLAFLKATREGVKI